MRVKQPSQLQAKVPGESVLSRSFFIRKKKYSRAASSAEVDGRKGARRVEKLLRARVEMSHLFILSRDKVHKVI